MIEISGEISSSEHKAALYIAQEFEALWPGISSSLKSEAHIKIAANVNISGYRVADIDIVITGYFSEPKPFVCTRQANLKSPQKSLYKQKVFVDNFIITVEVKDHDEKGIQISGDKVKVKYPDGVWKSATDQNINQVHSLSPYIKDRNIKDVFVYRVLCLQGSSSIYDDIAATVFSGFCGADFFSALIQPYEVRLGALGPTVSSGAGRDLRSCLDLSIYTPIAPSGLDRKKMDRLSKHAAENADLANNYGEEMLCLRGYGGTGKTAVLLQTAYSAAVQESKRTLFLTYNHALASDVARVMALMNVSSSDDGGGIRVTTVMRHLYSWFRRLEIIDSSHDPAAAGAYETLCKKALEFIEQEAITLDDVAAVTQSDPDLYDYDAVVIDEAQDWPQEEADLIKVLYGSQNIRLADGIDQMLRGGKRTDWFKGMPKSTYRVKSLSRGLRMKKNLAVFANDLSEEVGLNWSVSPNEKAGGGSVYILKNPYKDYKDLHATLLSESEHHGNKAIDALFCVPSSAVYKSGESSKSYLSDEFLDRGLFVWDGVDPITRKDFPRDLSQHRIVQYQSCRGLEGWFVVLDAFDEAWDQAFESVQGLEVLPYEDKEVVLRNKAWHKLLIALTRPIDTLVITLSDIDSEASETILTIAKKNQSFVTILD